MEYEIFKVRFIDGTTMTKGVDFESIREWSRGGFICNEETPLKFWVSDNYIAMVFWQEIKQQPA